MLTFKANNKTVPVTWTGKSDEWQLVGNWRFFDLLEKFAMGKTGPEQIWNVDEKSFNPDPAPKRVVAGRRGMSVQVHQKWHDYVTAIVWISTTGAHLPPQLIFTDNRERSATGLVNNGPPGALFSTIESGSMDQELSVTCFERIFLTGTSRSRCQLLLLGNHIQPQVCPTAGYGQADQRDIPNFAVKNDIFFSRWTGQYSVAWHLTAQNQAVSAAACLLQPGHALRLKI